MPPAPIAAGTDRVLVIPLDSERYALPLAAVSDLAEFGPLRRVPLAPEGVLGLAEWRGRIVTVLDLARILGRTTAAAPRCLVRLAPPLDHLALAVPSAPRLVSVAPAPAEDSPRADLGDAEGRLVLLDPESLLAAPAPGAFQAPCRR
jgi:purine-binding chemotaxis protein CheW